MTDKEIKLRKIIADFERRGSEGHVAIDLIKNLTGKTIDIGYLSEYWASESLDMFVEKLLVEHIQDWQSIDDKKAIELITEIQENVSNEGLVIRNSTALERRYSKSTGTVIDIIFNRGGQNPKLILEELKTNTRIFL
jgi:hypothetical protein